MLSGFSTVETKSQRPVQVVECCCIAPLPIGQCFVKWSSRVGKQQILMEIHKLFPSSAVKVLTGSIFSWGTWDQFTGG